MKRGIRLLKFVLPVLAVTAAVLTSCQKEPEYFKAAPKPTWGGLDYNKGEIVVTKGADIIPAGSRVEIGDTYTIKPALKTRKFASVTVNGTEILGDNKSEVSYTVPSGDRYLLEIKAEFEGVPIKFNPKLIWALKQNREDEYKSGEHACIGDTIFIIPEVDGPFNELYVNGVLAEGEKVWVNAFRKKFYAFPYVVEQTNAKELEFKPVFTFIQYKGVVVKELYEGEEYDMPSSAALYWGAKLLMLPVFGQDAFEEVHVYKDTKCKEEFTTGVELASDKTYATFTVPEGVGLVYIKVVYPPIDLTFPADVTVGRIKADESVEPLATGAKVQPGDQLAISAGADKLFYALSINGKKELDAIEAKEFLYTVEDNLTGLRIEAETIDRGIKVATSKGLAVDGATHEWGKGWAKVGDALTISPAVAGQVFLSLSLTREDKKETKIENIKGKSEYNHTVVSADTLLVFKAELGVKVQFDAATVAVTVNGKAPEEYVALGTAIVIAPKVQGKKFATLKINGTDIPDAKGKEQFGYTIAGKDGKVEIEATVE